VTGEEIMTSAANPWQLGRLHHLGVTVADIDRSIEFYRDILGMELVGRRPCVEADYVAKQTGYPGVQLSVASFRVSADNPQTLEVVQYLNCPGEAVDQATNRPGNTHLCILVDDLQAAFDDLSQQGVQFKSDPVRITAGPNEGGLVVYFYDPDGYPMEMFQPPVQG
jgi:catechol 2,3-dioxygenase-like lactoylglutathione lyase family enzyme